MIIFWKLLLYLTSVICIIRMNSIKDAVENKNSSTKSFRKHFMLTLAKSGYELTVHYSFLSFIINGIQITIGTVQQFERFKNHFPPFRWFLVVLQKWYPFFSEKDIYVSFVLLFFENDISVHFMLSNLVSDYSFYVGAIISTIREWTPYLDKNRWRRL